MVNAHQKIILLGSGGLTIGQGGEFDYSGTQAIKALLEEGIEVILVNPNIATVQTNPRKGLKVYLYPVEAGWVEKVIIKEKPTAIIAGFGGQTALNCLFELENRNILEKYNVENLGTSLESLRMSENRREFARRMKEMGVPVPESRSAHSIEEALNAGEELGYPLIVRAAYTLGGLGGGFAESREQLQEIVSSALAVSPQVLIEESLKGWREVEYEVMRDKQGNAIAICNMENFDPLGVHTGDSIVVAPSQTLCDEEFQLLRSTALAIAQNFSIVGECNVQFALSPKSLDFYVIEINARLSRSSALASKATGYPIAYIAAKVVLGYSLLELKNPVTEVTSALYEPAMDYIAVKVPRWDLKKFSGVSREIGSTMKSVGEVMAIGRSFPEALQKAVRMVTENPLGLNFAESTSSVEQLAVELKFPTDTRLFKITDALRKGMSVDEIHSLTSIDRWFLDQMKFIVSVERDIEICSKTGGASESSRGLSKASTKASIEGLLNGSDKNIVKNWKKAGFSDDQIVTILIRGLGVTEKMKQVDLEALSLAFRRHRLAMNVQAVVKKIDTTAGEFPCRSNYLYLTYHGEFDEELVPLASKYSAIVIGAGPYSIGSSVEFDWCAVSCAARLTERNWHSVIVNCNPETVSTDYNSSDHLYFEEINLERILDIISIEEPTGVIVSMGGQTPNRLAPSLEKAGVRILGHSPASIQKAESRSEFSAILDSLQIDQPRWVAATNLQEIDSFVEQVGFPVIVRPSHVLSGAAMNVAYDRKSLDYYIFLAEQVSAESPIVISEFLLGADEIEYDGVAGAGAVVTGIISAHVENAGVHSGDATIISPALNLAPETSSLISETAQKIASRLNLNGPFNIQSLVHRGKIKVIECNARASRSFPFVSKVHGINLADLATDVFIGMECKPRALDVVSLVGVKSSLFSFARLSGADPVLGVEMVSTGEVGCIAHTANEALLLSLQASGIDFPRKGVLVSAGRKHEKEMFLTVAGIFKEAGIPIYATEGTGRFLEEHGHEVKKLPWPGEGSNDVINAIREGLVDLVINIPKNTVRTELEHGKIIRQMTVRYGCSLLTNMEIVIALMRAFRHFPQFQTSHEVQALSEYSNFREFPLVADKNTLSIRIVENPPLT